MHVLRMPYACPTDSLQSQYRKITAMLRCDTLPFFDLYPIIYNGYIRVYIYIYIYIYYVIVISRYECGIIVIT